MNNPADGSGVPTFLASLNPRQLAAAMHGTSPLLIIAGAGTGKTTTLAHRVAWQVASGVDPAGILLLTFTRRAAAEMLRRVEQITSTLGADDVRDPSLCQKSAIRRICGGTFHSAASALLRRHGHLIGLHPDFTIMDRGDSEDLLNLARTELKLPKSENRFPLKGTCLDIYSRCINTQQALPRVLEQWFPWCLEHQARLSELFSVYTDTKERQRVLDFDDLLLFWNALAADESGARIFRQQFSRILVDEYQDTNVLQAQILKNLCPDGIGLTAVGDDAQSIYSFRAATVRNILDFPQDYPGTELIALEQNYRSTQRILDVTNGVIAEAAERHHKELWSTRGPGAVPRFVTCADEDAQCEHVIEQILERREQGVQLKQQAVLFRASHHSMALEAALGRKNIPFVKYGGLRFLETAHVKDLISFLRLAENPLDSIAGFRILVLLPGIGQSKAARLLEQLREAEGRFDAWDSWGPPTALQDLWPQLVQLLRRLEARGRKGEGGVSADIHAVRQYYEPLLHSAYENAPARVNDLKQLETIAVRYESRQQFLTEMTLDPPASTQELPADPLLDEDFLILSTIHSAKGLEWDSVHVIHAADGNIPADMATGSAEEIEEERRLFYVAMTRAKNHLTVLRPERYYFHNRHRSDQHSLSRITRFLTPPILAMMEQVSHGLTAGSGGAGAGGGLVKGDTAEIRRRIAKLWG
ncbi:MAG: ATP-dependent helicase [Planctomyces sp.]|jgi:DNA helicase-2/ATP-dependent DNA helicase PcrA|nr:ATP-dependent helicase [Planctomyces sp.]GDX90537.1 DNA helicase [Planctomycetia bacterium]HAV33445.1 ATP-dependent DNA helicase [Planctomycetaceae bacterium]HBC61721.1 ATP-dependent DNA helicase [Planctomycetaceae bacterium]